MVPQPTAKPVTDGRVTESTWTSALPDATGHKLVQLPLPVLDALGNGDLQLSRDLYSSALTPYIANDCSSVWRRRAAQINADPKDAVWVSRLLLDKNGVVVGRAGFHGQPDEHGMVEVGYSVDPRHRRQGHARAALRILLDVAAAESRVTTVRASVSPDNIPSRSLVNQFGFVEVGEQWDDEDGREIVLEISCRVQKK
ncbi:hypothetical protein QQS21_011336 [Conoideocrella luteorostrata]|uniref:N-acetyltransferase domain-containing protein n=1 Tax=Conoideocrella luteorostrata TaxID=1105319 RepID=A0AAJ0CG14_9HYPO|nr:hypothetical protein QQS21_011336 [Conoideocrella luteorostrata]